MYTLKTNVQGHYESLDGILFYTISVSHSPTDILWIINRKLEEFHSLYVCLIEKFQSVPEPPGYNTLSYLSLYFSSVIPELDAFLAAVLNLPSIYSSEEIYTFFDVGLHVPKYPAIKNYLTGDHLTRFIAKSIQVVDDLIISTEADYAALHRLEQYLMLIGYSGSVINIIRFFTNNRVHEQYSVQIITSFLYLPVNKTLILGLETGDIQLVSVKNLETKAVFETTRSTTAHFSPVTGIVNNEHKIFTCGTDGRLIITSLNDPNSFTDITLSFIPKKMMKEQNFRLLYFCDEQSVYVLEVANLQGLRTINPGWQISTFTVSHKGFIFVAGVGGGILGYTAEGEAMCRMEVKGCPNGLWVNEELSLIGVGDSNGIVSIWNESGDAVYRWKTHESVNDLVFNGNVCVTAGCDLKVRSWRIDGLFN